MSRRGWTQAASLLLTCISFAAVARGAPSTPVTTIRLDRDRVTLFLQSLAPLTFHSLDGDITITSIQYCGAPKGAKGNIGRVLLASSTGEPATSVLASTDCALKDIREVITRLGPGTTAVLDASTTWRPWQATLTVNRKATWTSGVTPRPTLGVPKKPSPMTVKTDDVSLVLAEGLEFKVRAAVVHVEDAVYVGLEKRDATFKLKDVATVSIETEYAATHDNTVILLSVPFLNALMAEYLSSSTVLLDASSPASPQLQTFQVQARSDELRINGALVHKGKRYEASLLWKGSPLFFEELSLTPGAGAELAAGLLTKKFRGPPALPLLPHLGTRPWAIRIGSVRCEGRLRITRATSTSNALMLSAESILLTVSP